jgi:hypothetical protein
MVWIILGLVGAVVPWAILSYNRLRGGIAFRPNAAGVKRTQRTGGTVGSDRPGTAVKMGSFCFGVYWI